MRSRGLALAIVFTLLATALTFGGCAEEPARLGPRSSTPAPAPAGTPSATQDAQEPQSESKAPAPTPEPDQPATSSIKTTPARVIRVVDGDTAVIRIDGKSERVRFIGVNTPESTTRHEPYGEEASAYTKRRLTGAKVYLETDAELRDRYDRLLAYVWLEPPAKLTDAEIRAHQFNAQLLLDGFAQMMTYPPNVKYVDYFQDYQREARDSDKGLWALPAESSSSPSGSGETRASGVIGSRRSQKFHLASCQWGRQISARNLASFANRDAALDAGYQPCKVCRP